MGTFRISGEVECDTNAGSEAEEIQNRIERAFYNSGFFPQIEVEAVLDEIDEED